MRKILLIAFAAFALILFNTKAHAQLPDGSYGKNFTMQDYLGTTYSLYDYTDAGKSVVLDISATWCSPCWAYHTGGYLETYYNTYGPSGDNTSMVFWIEGDQSNLQCLQNVSGCDNGTSQGDWTAGTPFPMFLTVSPNTAQVVTDYAISYFPTIYVICPNRKVTEAGQQTAAGLHSVAAGCPAPGVNALDAAVWSSNVPSGLCETTTSPTFYIQNYGSTTLTSCNVVVKLDGSTVSTTPWTGSLAKYEYDQVVIPQVTGITEGTHILTFEITGPNGGTDDNAANNTLDVSFAATLPVTSLPLQEGFVGAAFPPTNWLIMNPDNDATWKKSTLVGGFGNTTNSAYIDFYNIESGGIDDINLPPVDFSSSTNPMMTFNIAHKRYSTSYSDDLKVQVSTNCGTSWTTVWNKSGATLATVTGTTTNEYVPAAGDWRAENVDLSAYAGQAKVYVRIRATSGYGNDLYLDDINISTTGASVNELSALENVVNVYPNPVSSNAVVSFTLPKSESISINICDLLGQNVLTIGEQTYSAGDHTANISTQNLNSGIYYLNMMAGEEKITKKIVIVK